jgi:hypothetical protein
MYGSKKLMIKLQEAVTTAHETSTAFSDIFELSKQQEMKEMLGGYADGQVEMFQRVSFYSHSRGYS